MDRAPGQFDQEHAQVGAARFGDVQVVVLGAAAGDAERRYLHSRMNATRPPRPRHNPFVRELVQSKRERTRPLPRQVQQEGFRGWHENSYFPHRDEPGLTQFITFRLDDLRAWVVMPNHVHLLVEISATPMWKLLDRWKGFTAKEANKAQ